MFSARRGAGHLGSLIPFAKAFLRNNDEVVVVVPWSAGAAIAASGLDHLPYPDPVEEEGDARHAYPFVLGAIRGWRPDALL
jgi:hypothetical protein